MPESRPVIRVAIRPKDDADRESLQRVLNDLAREDASMRVGAASAEGEAVIGGVQELHLRIICERISREFGIQIEVGPPEVIYLETIRKKSEAEGKYVRVFSRHHNYGHVKIRLEPLEPGIGYEFIDDIKGDAIPAAFRRPVDLGIQEAMKGGILQGHEMVDIRAVLYDGSYHAKDSNEMAFKIAGAMAFKEAARQASPVVLEPIMTVEVSAPDKFVGAIVGDLSLRRGRIEGLKHSSGWQVIRATVPLANLLGYPNHVPSLTQGKAAVSMKFLGYERAPHPDDPGENAAGVTATKPKSPQAGSGFAAAQWDDES